MGSRKHVNPTKLTPKAYRRAGRRGLRQKVSQLLRKDLTPQEVTAGGENFERMTDIRIVKVRTTRARIAAGRQDGAEQLEGTAERVLNLIGQAAA